MLLSRISCHLSVHIITILVILINTFDLNDAKMTRKQIFLVIFCVNSSTVVTIRGMKATEEGKPASVKVSFKVKKTGKASKYSYTSKVVVTAEKPVTNNATKISSASVTAADVIEVKFDGVITSASAAAITLTRAGSATKVTAALSADATSVTLKGDSAFPTGTYTIALGDMNATVVVEKQTPKTLQINTDKVGISANAAVVYQVLDQYGNDMQYSSSKLTVQAYDSTKGIAVAPTTSSKKYFTLNTATTTAAGNNAIAVGDTIHVVAYLSNNASVVASKDLEVTTVFTESFEFGDIKLGDDKRVTENGTYELPYTASNNLGEVVVLDKRAQLGTASGSYAANVTNGLTFISSNTAALPTNNISIDKDGVMTFKAGTEGTAILTVMNNYTGKQTSLTIVVNKTPQLSELVVDDMEVAFDIASTANATVKAPVVAYDQFGEVISATKCKNLSLSTLSQQIAPATAGFSVDTKLSDDGQYVVYKITSGTTLTKDQTITVTFTSTATGAKGYITSTAKIFVSDDVQPAALKMSTEPTLSLGSGATTKINADVLDNYNNKMTAAQLGAAKNGATTTTTGYKLIIADPDQILNQAAMTGFASNEKDITSSIGSNVDLKVITNSTGATKKGTVKIIVVSSNDATNVIAQKSYTISVAPANAKFVTNTDKEHYTVGDKIVVTVDAYTSAGYNSDFNGDVAVEVTLTGSSKKYNTTLKFTNGTATYELTANDISATKVIISTIETSPITTQAADASAFDVVAGSASKLTVDTNSYVTVEDIGGNTVSSYEGKKSATIKVEDLTLNSDITGDCTFGSTLNTDKTYVLTFTAGVSDALPTVTVPTVNQGNAIKITVTIGDLSYTKTIKSGSGAYTIGTTTWS